MPQVLNRKFAGIPVDAVYVGRPSKWGNPFVVGRHGTRDEVVALYEDWLKRQPHLMASLRELRDKDLVCHCAPSKCHADILLRYANRRTVSMKNIEEEND